MRAIPVALRLAALFALVLFAAPADAYPLDGWEHTGASRLEAFDLAHEVLLQRGTIRPGAMKRMDEVRLGLVDYPDFELPAPDGAFSAEIRSLLGGNAGAYGIAVLDITDPERPFYAEVNGGTEQNPGSVGKIVVALALFQALADVHPWDVEARNHALRDSVIPASNAFIVPDDHVVPFWKRGAPSIRRREIVEGDEGNSGPGLTGCLGQPSNAGGLTVMGQIAAVKHFGAAYPPGAADANGSVRRPARWPRWSTMRSSTACARTASTRRSSGRDRRSREARAHASRARSAVRRRRARWWSSWRAWNRASSSTRGRASRSSACST
jgi:hypothetical protein